MHFNFIIFIKIFIPVIITHIIGLISQGLVAEGEPWERWPPI
jgi:hypothetical protein